MRKELRKIIMGGLFLVIFTSNIIIPAQSVPKNELVPPPEPKIKPIVSAPTDVDIDKTKIDDALENKIKEAKKIMADTKSTAKLKSQAAMQLESDVRIELVFDKQITQSQIDSFLAAGGKIDHIFKSVSYGWTGSIPLKDVGELPSVMGNSLLGVVEGKPLQLHLDEAGKCGRVRPVVWNAGYDGNQTATNSKITIAVLDTGIDGSHTDLNGREEYWKDWTSDDHPSPQDQGHHGSHVTGIACGTGASAGASPSTISFMDLGTFPLSGFYLSPFHIPICVGTFNWTSTMYWDDSGVGSAAIGQAVYKSSDENWYLLSSTTSGTTSSLTETNGPLPNPISGYSNTYNATPQNGTGSSGKEYAVENTITYGGVGDGYNVFRGIAPDCKWAGFKIFTDAGVGNGTDSGEALDDVVTQKTTHRIKVTNMSFGTNGSPGINTTNRNKTNTAASNGIVMVVSAGNDGRSSGAAGETDDPGRSHYAITVASSSDTNQLTDYSSHGITPPGDSNTGDEDMKPDITAPGGSTKQSFIFSVDSNTADSTENTGANISDKVANNYLNWEGTSMAAPYITGCAALVIDALQQNGYTWTYTLDDVLKVKMILLMTATETNQNRETGGSSGNPTLDRGAKDINEGYGLVNADAAVDIAGGQLFSTDSTSDTFGDGAYDKRCWARKTHLNSGIPVSLSLFVPSTGDFDMYIYDNAPDTYGNPVIMNSSTSEGLSRDESISFTPSATKDVYLVIKCVSGDGTWDLTASGLHVPVELKEFSAD